MKKDFVLDCIATIVVRCVMLMLAISIPTFIVGTQLYVQKGYSLLFKQIYCLQSIMLVERDDKNYRTMNEMRRNES